MSNYKRLIQVAGLTVLTFILTAFSLQAQKGTVKGVVTDAQTGEALVGANVVLSGNNAVGAATNLDGEYTINGVPAGTVTLVARYIGYEQVERTVTVESNQTITVDFELGAQTIEGEEVVVSAQREGQVQAINQQLSSDQIVNVVSEAKISEMPDFNAAQAIGRLPGVSTQKSAGEANKVVIRGMSPEFNSIQIEGTRLSSTGSSEMGLSSDPNAGANLNNDRSVDLSMVSPYMVRMISVYKSLTPDMNANTIGGAVNMELRKAPADPHWSAMYQQGYMAKSNTIGNYRAVLSGSNRFFDDKLGVYALANVESYDRNADNMSADYGIAGAAVEIDPETGYRPVQVNSVSFNRHRETRNRYGANLILDYDLPDGAIKFVNMYAQINSDYTEYRQTLGYDDGRMDWALEQGENVTQQQLHSLKLDYDFGFMITDLSVSYTSSSNILDESPRFSFNQTNALTVSGDRDNQLPDELTRFVNFQGDSSVILRSGNLFSNDYQEERFTYKADFKIPFNVGDDVNGFFKVGGHIDNQINSTDQETPYLAFNGSATGEGDDIQSEMMRTIYREFNLTTDETGSINGVQLKNENDDLYDPFLNNRFGDVYFAPDADQLVNMLNFIIGEPRFDASNEDVSSGAQGGWYDGPYQSLANDYEYEEDYYATYAMTKVSFWDIMIVGGVRYENVDQEYFAYNARDQRNAQAQIMYDTTSVTGNDFILPMGQIKYTPADWMDVRYSYSQTLARPDFTSLSPKFTITQGNSIYTGNPNLKPAEAFNHDLSFSFHSNKLGLFTVGGFYKTIEDFVYTASYQINAAQNAGIDHISNYTLTCSQHYRDKYGDEYPSVGQCEDGTQLIGPLNNAARVNRPSNNPNDATVKGIELDLQTNFWYLPEPLNNIVFGVNYSRIWSELEYPFYTSREVVDGRDITTVLVDSSFTGRLIDQPNHVLNSYIGFDYKGFSTRLSATFESNSATNNGGEYPENDGYTTDYFRLDFSARQKLPFLTNSELFMDVTNLNDERTRQVQKSTGGFRGIQNYGLSANLGIRIRH